MVQQSLLCVLVFLNSIICFGQISAQTCPLSVISPVTKYGNTADNDAYVTWSKIPNDVTYKSSDKYDDGGLGPYFTLARSFVNTSIPGDFPFDIISGLLDGSFVITRDYQQVINAYIGYIVCIAIGLLFILIFTLVGLIFCCCRCCGNCGGKRIQDPQNNTSSKRIVFSLIFFLLILFIGVGVICLYVNNGRMTTVLNNFEDIYDNSITDAELFMDLLQRQVKRISVDNFNFTYEVLLRDMRGIDVVLGQRTKALLTIQSDISTAIGGITTLAATLQSLGSTLTNVDSGVTDVESKLTALTTALGTAKTDLDNTLASCSCGAGIDTSVLTSNFDTNTFPSLTDSMDKINSTTPSDLTDTINSANAELEKIPCQVQNESRANLDSLITTIDDFASSGLSTVDQQIEGVTNNFNLSTYKDQGDVYFKVAKEYDQYRWYGGIGLASLVLLITLLMLFGLLMGVCTSSVKQKPSERGCMSNSGGNMLIASVALIFIFSWLLMLLTTLTYAIGAPLEKWVCQPISNFDSKLYTELLDKPGGPLGDGYFLGGLILQNTSSEITLSGILKDCRDGKAAYTALHLSNLFDIDAALDYKSYIDLNSTLASISGNIDMTVTILTPEMMGYLQDIKDAVDVDTMAFLTELNKPLAATNLSSFAQDLRDLGDTLSPPHSTSMYNHATTLENIEANEFQQLQNSVDSLKVHVTTLNTTKDQVVLDVDNVNVTLQFTQDYLNTNGTILLNKEVTNYIDRLTRVIDSYIDFTKNALRNDMGRCNIVYNLFASVATVGVCKYFLDAWNGFWLSLGWCLFFFVPSVIFAVKLAKHFRRMSSFNDGAILNGRTGSKVFPSPFPSRNEPDVHFKEATPDSVHTSVTEVSDNRRPSAPPEEDIHDNKVGHMDRF